MQNRQLVPRLDYVYNTLNTVMLTDEKVHSPFYHIPLEGGPHGAH